MLPRYSSEGIPSEIQIKLDLFFGDLQKIGVFYIGHGVISKTGNHTGYFSNKKWGEFYINNQYFFHEPILKDFEENKIDLISWKKLKDMHSIAQERKEFTQVASGITIYKKDGEFRTFFNLGFNKDIDLAQFIFLKRDLLLAYFHIFNDYHLLWRKQKRSQGNLSFPFHSS